MTPSNLRHAPLSKRDIQGKKNLDDNQKGVNMFLKEFINELKMLIMCLKLNIINTIKTFHHLNFTTPLVRPLVP